MRFPHRGGCVGESRARGWGLRRGGGASGCAVGGEGRVSAGRWQWRCAGRGGGGAAPSGAQSAGEAGERRAVVSGGAPAPPDGRPAAYPPPPILPAHCGARRRVAGRPPGTRRASRPPTRTSRATRVGGGAASRRQAWAVGQRAGRRRRGGRVGACRVREPAATPAALGEGGRLGSQRGGGGKGGLPRRERDRGGRWRCGRATYLALARHARAAFRRRHPPPPTPPPVDAAALSVCGHPPRSRTRPPVVVTRVSAGGVGAAPLSARLPCPHPGASTP